MVLGHEPVGTVVEVGKCVTHLKVGDIVAVENAVPCCYCEFCRLGKYNLCDFCNNNAKGLPPADGCLRKFYNHDAPFCHK